MVTVEIPGSGSLLIKDVLLDFNGTIAIDGKIIDGVKEKINALANQIAFHVITADTFGSVERELRGVDCSLLIIGKEKQAEAKETLLNRLGAEHTIAVGNGANDALMVKAAVLGVAVLQEEGLATGTLLASDILIQGIEDLFAYFEKPERLVACLRC